MNKSTDWLALIISLPTSNATARMRIWRALKSAGCGVLRDGVYLLPDHEACSLCFQQQANQVITAGGTAHIVRLDTTHEKQDGEFRALFDRTDDYASLKQELDALLVSIPTQDHPASKRQLNRLSKDFAAITAIDFFPGPAREQLAMLLERAMAELTVASNPDEPHSVAGKIKRLNPDNYRNRTWATRKKLWVDRMASAWLIRRFIDPGAKFKWLNKPQDCPRHALGFDFDGAAFTHVDSLVTFEMLLASFFDKPDPALRHLAAVVHFLDVGGIPPAEAHGLELVLKGMRERCASDDELLAEATKIFDDLYLIYQNKESNDEQ